MILRLLLTAMVCAGALAAQQPPGTITGRVLFPDGTPVAGAKVKVSRTAGQDGETSTDALGAFTTGGLAPGIYQVLVEQDGVAGARRSVEVPQGGQARLDLVVALAGRRESITVSATLDPREAGSVPSSVTIFDG